MNRFAMASAGLLLAAAALPAQEKDAAFKKPTAEEITFFEKSIRPVLATKCYACHSAEAKKQKGGLRLDTREGLRLGGDSGRAIVPGNPRKSLLIQAISHQDKQLKMPPKEMLPESVIADFEHWVRIGAPDPRVGGEPIVRQGIDIAKGKQFWAFQPPRPTPPPAVKDTAWPRADLDRFVLARLEAKGMRPVEDADPHGLLRRLSFDLIGLPPTPEEIEEFVPAWKREPQAALAKVIDRLLASPRFGERWGRHWLDVARYGESSGRQVNFNYPFAWRYRNYVIDAFNADKPFDRFVCEQIAGDLMPAANPREQAQQKIATGFLAIGPKVHSERNVLQFQMDVVDEQIDVLSQAFLGLSVACARCHDHKFDPIPQKDYYALAGILHSSETCFGTIRVIQSFHASPLLEFGPDSGLPPGQETMTSQARQKMEGLVKEIRTRREEQARTNKPMTGADFNTLAITEAKLSHLHPDGTHRLLAMGVREGKKIADSPLYVRGEIARPGAVVPRGFLQILTDNPLPLATSQSGRLELARWLTSPQNPLTARVFVNRVWKHLFGRGLAPTVDNFGTSGLPPTHPELLDHLALEFQKDGWSIKRLIKRIVLSRTYQLGAAHSAVNDKLDPDNGLLWRMSPRRLDAEALRDAILAVSGQLVLTPPASSPVHLAGEGPATALMRQLTQLDSRDFHRAVYLPVLRDSVLESLALFDFADPNQVVGERSSTNVPSQALYLLNSPFVQGRAEAAADRLLALKSLSNADKVQRVYLLCLGRAPTQREKAAAADFLARYPKTLASEGIAVGAQPKATWTAFCQALFASADFLYRN
jgi:cytochrome c553